jgi:hypothetical protein
MTAAFTNRPTIPRYTISTTQDVNKTINYTNLKDVNAISYQTSYFYAGTQSPFLPKTITNV